MHLPRSHPTTLAGAALLALLAAACTDRDSPLDPDPVDPTGPAGTPIALDLLQCRASVVQETVTCGKPSAMPAHLPNYLIVGNQNIFVSVTSSNVNYDAPTQAYTFDVTVRNLIKQPLGTANLATLAPDANGVRIFFYTAPAVTGGTGSVTVANENGSATFIGSPADYFQYNAVLEQYEVSAPVTWQFTIDPTVTSFEFSVLIAAVVPFENGYIEVAGNTNVRSGNDRQLVGTVRDAVGTAVVGGAVTAWSTSDPLLASINASGLLHGLRDGVVSVTGTEAGGRPTWPFSMTVHPIRRTWTAGAGVGLNDWANGANWSPDAVVPTANDTAVIPAAPSGGNFFPVLSGNVDVGGVEVDVAPANIEIGAFDLTASGDVSTATGGVITGTVGRLRLTGIARMVGGVFPQIIVNGTYSLSANVTLSRRLRVESGRLRNTSFRVRVNNP